MQIRVQACAPASVATSHNKSGCIRASCRNYGKVCAHRHTMPVPTHGSCDEKTPYETTPGSFRNTPFVSYQFHCTSALLNHQIDINTQPFLPVAEGPRQEGRLSGKRERTLLSYGHSLLNFFSDHIWLGNKACWLDPCASLQSATDTRELHHDCQS